MSPGGMVSTRNTPNFPLSSTTMASDPRSISGGANVAAIPPPPPPPPPPPVENGGGRSLGIIAAAAPTDAAAPVVTTTCVVDDTAVVDAALPPPPPFLDNNNTDDAEKLRETIVSAASALEIARCYATELEGWTLFATSQLLHQPSLSLSNSSDTTIDTTDLPPTVIDAWNALAMAATTTSATTTSTPSNTEVTTAPTNASGAAAVMGGGADVDNNHKNILQLMTGGSRGQQAVAVQTLCRTKALQRMAQMAAQLQLEQQSQPQQPISTATTTTTRAQLFQQLKQQLASSTHSGTTASNTTTSPHQQQQQWMQIFYDRLQELRTYHAEHDTTSIITSNGADTTTAMSLQQQDRRKRTASSMTTNVDDRNTIPRWNDGHHSPQQKALLDGYDLAGTVREWTSSQQLDMLYTTDEVMGKYLDLQDSYTNLIRQLSILLDDRIENEQKPLNNHQSRTTLAGMSTAKSSSSSKTYLYIDFLQDLNRGLGTRWKESNKLVKRKKYGKWLQELQTYLQSFITRTMPLINIEQEILIPADAVFVQTWSKTGGYGSGGWQNKPSERNLVVTTTTTIPTVSKNDDSTATTADATMSTGELVAGESTTVSTTMMPPKLQHIDLQAYETAEALAAAQVDGGEILKTELSLLGMKCGGTLMDRAKRLFLVKDKPLAELPSKVFAAKAATKTVNVRITTSEATVKTTGSNADSGPSSVESVKAAAAVVDTTNGTTMMNGGVMMDDSAGDLGTMMIIASYDRRIDLARQECWVTALLDQLQPTLEATIQRTERQQTQTIREREREMEEELYRGSGGGGATSNNRTKKNVDGDNEDDDEDDDDDEDAPIYNPKNVPLDFDGKPIPYWLFKLHGLNHYYTCEICNGESYRGRRAFELHFGETTHAAGMRSLGIPNTKHFHGVTTIADAQELWSTLQYKLQQTQFDAMIEEEYEDSHGNVLSRTTYEDLARQGLL